MLSWQILLAISVVTYSVSVILQKAILKNKKSDPVAYSIVFQIVTGLIIGIYALINGFKTPDLIPLIPNLIVMVLLYGIGNILIFKALKVADASSFTIMFSSRAIWMILGAVIFLKESFSGQQLLGTLLIILSVILVSWKSGGLRMGKGVVFSLLGALAFGLAFTNDAYILNNFDVPSYLTFSFLLPPLLIWAVYPKSTAKMKPLFERGTFIKLLILGVIYAVSSISIFLAYQVGKNASQIAPLNQVSTILTVLLSMIFLKETDNKVIKILGAIISFVGVVLVK